MENRPLVTFRETGKPDEVREVEVCGKGLPGTIEVPVLEAMAVYEWPRGTRMTAFRTRAYRLLKVTQANHLGPTAAIYGA